jgi:16S rRNA pseudouridine516 synthase
MAKLSLDRILQSQGFGTRKWCQRLIEEGEVQVQGALVRDPRALFETAGLQFAVFGDTWAYHEHLYIALNKPANIECSRKPSHHPGVMSLLPEQFSWRDVQSIGRLDHDTTGMLLLTDDGAFNHAMSSPRRHISKTYLATTFAPVTETLIQQLLTGVQLHDEPAPLAANTCRQVGEHQLEIILAQGKYHQVKRMLAAADHHCTALARIAIGELQLSSLSLAPGEWCLLSDTQRHLLR